METGVLETRIPGPKAHGNIPLKLFLAPVLLCFAFSLCMHHTVSTTIPNPFSSLFLCLTTIFHLLPAAFLDTRGCFGGWSTIFSYCCDLWHVGFGFTASFVQECSWSLAVLCCLLCCAALKTMGAVTLSQTRADAETGQDLTFGWWLWLGCPKTDHDASSSLMMALFLCGLGWDFFSTW